jgi:hypothetical protein
MSVHRIRLRGPWRLETTAEAENDSARTVRLPTSWSELVDAGLERVRLSRNFHRPTNLGPADHVSLVVEELPEGASVSLNGTPLDVQAKPANQTFIFPAPQLEPNNVLSLEFEVGRTPRSADTAWGEIALVISSP